jgi:hypothetical protein
MVAHVALQVVWRYRVPYWDPILILYGAFGAARPMTVSTGSPCRGSGEPCAAIFLAALAIRLAAAAAAGFATTPRRRARLLGRRPRAGFDGSIPAANGRVSLPAPGYAFSWPPRPSCHPDAIPAAKVATAVTGALEPCSRPLSRRASSGGGGPRSRPELAAIQPTLVLVSADLQSEPLFILLLLASGIFCSRRPTARPRTSAVLAERPSRSRR